MKAKDKALLGLGILLFALGFEQMVKDGSLWFWVYVPLGIIGICLSLGSCLWFYGTKEWC